MWKFWTRPLPILPVCRLAMLKAIIKTFIWKVHVVKSLTRFSRKSVNVCTFWFRSAWTISACHVQLKLCLVVKRSESVWPHRSVPVWWASCMCWMNHQLVCISVITTVCYRPWSVCVIWAIPSWWSSMMKMRFVLPIILLISVRVPVCMVGMWLPKERMMKFWPIRTRWPENIYPEN